MPTSFKPNVSKTEFLSSRPDKYTNYPTEGLSFKTKACHYTLNYIKYLIPKWENLGSKFPLMIYKKKKTTKPKNQNRLTLKIRSATRKIISANFQGSMTLTLCFQPYSFEQRLWKPQEQVSCCYSLSQKFSDWTTQFSTEKSLIFIKKLFHLHHMIFTKFWV